MRAEGFQPRSAGFLPTESNGRTTLRDSHGVHDERQRRLGRLADKDPMSNDLARILRLEVPLIVQIAERRMPLSEVTALTHGSIIELPKQIDEELDVLVNNSQIGSGRAVKVGENFGVRMTNVGAVTTRVAALGG
jgi:flagellar motor switch protein FliN/FliY